MNYRPIVLVVGAELALRLAGLPTQDTFYAFSILSSLMLLESQRDFESVAAEFNADGLRASAPSMLFGKSGVKHEFSFGILSEGGKPKVVLDTELSVKEVDEMKVLKFYVKVFDVSPETAILCVSPRLSERAKQLAEEYSIKVIEDETPRNLIPLAGRAVKELMGRGAKR